MKTHVGGCGEVKSDLSMLCNALQATPDGDTNAKLVI